MDAFPSPRHPLSLALIGLDHPATDSGTRARVEWAGSLGFGAVQIDASAPDTRPRNLDRSARRDLAALLRRNGLAASGVDLWFPPAHLADPAHMDRAVAALSGAIELAAELADLTAGHPILSTTLPTNPAAQAAIDTLVAHAQRHGVRLADHAWPPRAVATPTSPLAVGIDPAAIFLAPPDDLAPGDPAAAVSKLGGAVASVRLCDLSSAGRVEAGAGRLDELAYLVAIATAGITARLVLDLRGLKRQETVARETLERIEPPEA